MSILSKIRRTIINEGSVYKASDLFLINESSRFPLPFVERDFLYQEEIPKEYLLLGSNEDWDIYKRCFKFLNRNKFEPIEGKEVPSVFVGGPPYDANNLNPDEPNDFIWHSKDTSRDSSYCKLFLTYKKLDPNRQEDFLNDISRIFWFVRPNEYENQTKFHTLMNRVAYYDTPEEIFSTTKTISNLIKNSLETNDDSDDNVNVGKVIDRLRKIEKGEKITQERIDKLIRDLKYSVYAAYEKSFIGEFFEEFKGDYRLKWLKPSGGNTFYSSNVGTEVEIKGFKDLILNIEKKVKQGIPVDYGEYVDLIIKSVDSLHIDEAVTKADIKLKSGKNITIYGSKNNIFGSTEPNLFEVKKRPYNEPSYLSEYFSLYKSSVFSKKYGKNPLIKEIYNKLVGGLYHEFHSGSIGTDIINAMRKKMVGIFFDEEYAGVKDIKMPIFVPIWNIKLEWSDKGWADKKRLSIRYSLINEDEYFFYNRANNEIIPQDLIEEYIGLPYPNDDIDESIINSGNLLAEGRKEDLIKKYSKKKKSKKIINTLSDGDPSGNNKYLPWMVKTYYKEGGISTEEMIELIELFHKNIQRIKNKDINSYKDFDSLYEVVEEAEKKRKETELKKEVKKQKTVIYEDDRWFVVSPHSWKASCFYGAGTKWCVTSKDTKVHWDNYSKRASFFYVIDKKKKQKDPLYKVAYRIIGSGGRYELWDAEDFEISKRKKGQKWFNKLPPEIIERAQIYHHEKFPKGERTALIEDDPRAQALFNHLNSDDIEDDVGYWYGLPIYGVDGDSWVAADEDEMYDAMWEYFDNYDDGDLFEYYDLEGYYLDMDDEEGFIDSEVEDYLDNLGEQEILEISGYINRKSDLEEEISELKSRLEDEEDEDEIDELESEIGDLEYELEDLVDEAKEEVGDSYRENWERCLQDGPVDCLVHEKGWFDVDGLWRSGLVSLRRTDLIEQLASDGDWDTVTSGYGYDESEDDEGNEWIVFEVDY